MNLKQPSQFWWVMVCVVGVLLPVGQHACATDMIIREPQVLPAASNYTSLGRVDRPFKRVDADAYFRQGVELLPGGSAGNYQAGSRNLTNWSQLETNVLQQFLRTNDVVNQTNTWWLIKTSAVATMTYAADVVLSEATNTLATYTPAADMFVRVEYSATLDDALYNHTESFSDVHPSLGVSYTTPSGHLSTRQLHAELYTDSDWSSPTNDHIRTKSGGLWLQAAAGTTVSVTNYVSANTPAYSNPSATWRMWQNVTISAPETIVTAVKP